MSAKDVDAVFSRNLRIQRMQAGRTQADLAEASGVSRSMIAMIENGYTALTLETAVAISDALCISLLELIDGQMPCTHPTIERDVGGWRCTTCGTVVTVTEVTQG